MTVGAGWRQPCPAEGDAPQPPGRVGGRQRVRLGKMKGRSLLPPWCLGEDQRSGLGSAGDARRVPAQEARPTWSAPASGLLPPALPSPSSRAPPALTASHSFPGRPRFSQPHPRGTARARPPVGLPLPPGRSSQGRVPTAGIAPHRVQRQVRANRHLPRTRTSSLFSPVSSSVLTHPHRGTNYILKSNQENAT